MAKRMKAWTICHGKQSGLDPVVPLDDNPGSKDEGMLVYSSEKAAKFAARHQANLYAMECRAVPLDDVLEVHEVGAKKPAKKAKKGGGK